jgi:membrane-bound serine protease (ClpP class)
VRPAPPRPAPLRPPLALIGLLLCLLSCVWAVIGPAAAGVRLVPGEGPAQIVRVPISGTVELGLAPFVRRAVAEAEASGADAILVEVDTFGGRVDAAAQIRDALLETPLPVVVFVSRRAISAGALISLAGDALYMAPGASMGAATPVQLDGDGVDAADEKMISYMRAELRATAEATGRPARLAEAMADRDVEIVGVIAAGKLLTVTAAEAQTLGLSDGTLPDQAAVLAAIGAPDAEVRTPALTWGERLARLLTEPAVSGALLSLGLLGLALELYHPGLGLPGAVGAGCLGAFLMGHVAADLVGWEEVLLFGLGGILLGIELFVTPGFGLVGVLGILSLGAGLALSMTALPPAEAWSAGLVVEGLQIVILSMGAAATVLMVAALVLPRGRLPRWMVLDRRIDSTAAGAPPASPPPAPDHAHMVGWQGVALTDLRLSGHARLGPPGAPPTTLVDVVSERAYIDQNTPVVVVLVEGARVVVDALPR